MSKHSTQMFKSSSNKWRRRLAWVALVAVLLPPLIFLRDVYRIPDYRGGDALISSSPDGVYKGMTLYVPETAPFGGIVSLAIGFSGYSSRSVVAVADGKTGRILAYASIGRNAYSFGGGGFWTCVDRTNGPCILYQSSFLDPSIELPPKPWNRLIAWGAWTLRGLGEPDFGTFEQREGTVLMPE